MNVTMKFGLVLLIVVLTNLFEARRILHLAEFEQQKYSLSQGHRRAPKWRDQRQATPALSTVRLRIYDGEKDSQNLYPYVISILRTGRRYCSGSLIHENWVITSAHCYGGDRIRYGNHTQRNSNSTSLIIRWIIYPNFRFYETEKSDIIVNDIALLLVKKVPLKRVGKLSAIDYETLMGRTVTYAGFGRTYIRQSTETAEERDEVNPLMLAQAMALKCDPHEYGGNSLLLCASAKCSKKGQMSLAGDSGGPMLRGGKIVGILSAGRDLTHIAEFTPVSPYLDWIHNVMFNPKFGIKGMLDKIKKNQKASSGMQRRVRNNAPGASKRYRPND